MSEPSINTVPRSFWVIGGIALVWNLLGLMAYLMQVTIDEATLAAMPTAERAVYESMPTWAVSAFAIAVNAGVLASLLLLLRRTWAVPVFIVSLVAVVIQDAGALFVAGAIEGMAAASAIMPVLVLLIGGYLVVYSRSAKQRGWLR
ncbi:MAG: hypothetical protein MUP90_17010 [Gammaproteobacteria bacterium]|nr:hypothetical protein [Gammaproteobacteria bacterium]